MRLVPEEPRPRAAFSLSDAEQGQDIRSPQTKASAGTGKPEAGLPPADPDETREMPLKRETPLRAARRDPSHGKTERDRNAATRPDGFAAARGKP